VSKALIVQTGQQGHIMSEKKTMEMLDHPFIIKLYQTYKDKDRLYFLLEPSLGGDLFSVLREKTLFDESAARFYAACVISAFEYMHSKNIVYRDLKPENLLIDREGYLKVTDFGFAKDISGGRTWTLCGTPDYLAPEIVAGKGHGKGVDWWTVGVFIYEMLASYAPFYDEDPMKTYEKIVHGDIAFPSHFSKEAIHLIKKLLHRKPVKRLGVTKGGAKSIKKHAWFKGFDWDALLEKKLTAPMTPVIKSPLDMSNIDEYQGENEEVPEVEPYVDDGSGWDKDF
jgi:serine/threonine protein kinase